MKLQLASILVSITASLVAIRSASADGDFARADTRSIDGAGRNIMRTADGGIIAAFGRANGAKSELVFSRSADNGKSWDNVAVDGVAGTVKQVAVDSNFNGSYIAFTEESNGATMARIAYFSSPFAKDAKYVVSAPVTPTGISPQDTFIQASRRGWGDQASENRETVVYGWQDASTKGLYIGVSLDGKTFPKARLIVSDDHATSGPAVAIRGKFVIATYQTTNPATAPVDVPAEARAGRSYPAWIESTDAGATWSQPAPLFGLTSDKFPMADIKLRTGEYKKARLGGGESQPNSPILNWNSSTTARSFAGPGGDKTLPQADDRSKQPSVSLDDLVDKLGGTTFVQTSMMAVDVNGKQGEVSIVSFRPIEPNAEWTHVIANNKLTDSAKWLNRETSRIDNVGSQFQYSALIDTPVRATLYKETDVKANTERIVVAVSTDTGKHFMRHLSFTKQQLQKLGIKDFSGATVFAASQCLFEDRNGEVYSDIIVSTDTGMHYARIPIGVNAAALRAKK